MQKLLSRNRSILNYKSPSIGREDWDHIARKESVRPYILESFGVYKKNEHIRLISEWIGETEDLNILKTDLFEEALGPDQFLFDMFQRDRVFGIDISQFVVNMADIKAKNLRRRCYFKTGDVRKLPYKDEMFDVIISNSTLDHFKKDNLLGALLELKRVLKKNGKLILTMNNKHNINFYSVLRIGRFLRLIPYPVEFYTIKEIKRIINKAGLMIKDTTAIVHLISPANKMLLCLRYVLGSYLINVISGFLVKVARILGRAKTRFFTGWFSAFLITKCDRNDVKQ